MQTSDSAAPGKEKESRAICKETERRNEQRQREELEREVISHLSTSSLLSDKKQFTSFFRTVPSDAFQSKVLSQLILHFGWTWVGLVALANDYGQLGIQVIKQEILKSGACVEFTEYIQIGKTNSNIVQIIKASTAQAVVIFSTDVHLLPLLDELMGQNVTGKIWVASEGWSTSSLFSSEKYSNLLAGTMGFAFYSGNIPGFQKYLDHISPSSLPEKPWNWMFWEENVGCAFLDFENFTFSRQRPSRNCTEEETIADFHTFLKQVPNIRITIYVIAKALHDLHSRRSGNSLLFGRNCSDFWNIKPWQKCLAEKASHRQGHCLLGCQELVATISSSISKTTRVKLSSGRDVFFDVNGDPPPLYDLVNWQLGSPIVDWYNLTFGQ
ncbi:unnamed protein product [Ranitomeya imitator]|uniref:Receptor ligand binding region domain-containing protein n=1 Tax=Ranitomeya imitator TaxID=111125 RepID=A0ABN9M941_9NEOB|nr:unnamed protein product [Ranitomeya imitator]